MTLLTIFPVQSLPELRPSTYGQLKLRPIFPLENLNSSHYKHSLKFHFKLRFEFCEQNVHYHNAH